MNDILKYCINKFKHKYMNNNQLNQLKKQYKGKEYTWKQSIMGEEVGSPTKCINVIQRQDSGEVCLELNNGSPVSLSRIDMYLTPSSTSFNQPVPVSELLDQGVVSSDTPRIKQNVQTITPIIDNIHSSPINRVEPTKQSNIDMFSGFKTNDEKFNLTLNIKLPDVELVKLMYKNSNDKDVFISQFSEYIKSSIILDNIKDSVIVLLNDEI
jgi:hypothetical protein